MNANPLSSIFEGDVNITLPCNTSLYGPGNLNVVNNGSFYGTTDSTSPISGALVVYGGLGVNLNANFGQTLSVLYGTSNLTSTIIDTTNGPVTVTGGNMVSISVGGSSQFVVTQGTLTLTSQVQNVYINGGANSGAAISLTATNNAGGILLQSGSGIGGVSTISGSGGITAFSSSGTISMTCNNASMYLTNNTLVDNQNISIQVNGNTNSKLLLQSSGIYSAIVLNTTNTGGTITISNNNGLGNGSINMNTGTGGINIYTNTSGNTNIITRAANANFLITSPTSPQTMTIGITSANTIANASALVLTSSGTNNAISIVSTNTSGNIMISQASYSNGGVNVFAGMGGFNVVTQTGGSVNVDCYGNVSNYTNYTTNNGQDMSISVLGGTQSRVNIICDGTTSDAVNIYSTGGIYGYSDGPISFQSSDIIQIATNNAGTGVQIGTPTSVTTIIGNLDVKGTTTSIESINVTIDDNIIIVNNAPSGTSNGGLGIKRWQYANNISAGDVVQDTPDETGTLQAANTVTSITLPFTSNALDSYYNDYWIMITSGTGAGQVRKIKSYTGITKVAVIYGTADQTTQVPVEGLDFLTTPNNTSGYSLFPCGYEFMIWNEFTNEFEFGCAPNTTNNSLNHYANVKMNNITATNINTTTINNSTADIITSVVLTNNSLTHVSITAFPNNYGVYTVMVADQVSNGAFATFTIARNSYSGNCGVCNRIVNCKGSNGEMVDMSWPSNSNPQLYYRPSKQINGTTTYNIKIISI